MIKVTSNLDTKTNNYIISVETDAVEGALQITRAIQDTVEQILYAKKQDRSAAPKEFAPQHKGHKE